MCRVLIVKSDVKFGVASHLEKLSAIARQSRYFQGNGWGCAYRGEDDTWKLYRSALPIWEDNRDRFGFARELLAHTRSAHEEGQNGIEYVMPFHRNGVYFLFNGLLRGVNISIEGRNGAEKIFSFIQRYYSGDLHQALKNATTVLKKRCTYIKAMNIIMADARNICVHTLFNEQEDYYTLHRKQSDNGLVVCSAPYPGEDDWEALPNGSLLCIPK